MPLYTILTQAGSLDDRKKAEIAGNLTDLHSEYANVPRNWVHVVFQDFASGSGFSAGEPASTVALTLAIRTGRSDEYKQGLLTRLWDVLQKGTGAPDDQIVIGIQELPASQAMEMGKIMPSVVNQPVS
jgi:phenylpyruvate tautomerase PptA (4-oxalocrotonate tautomerase family)